MNAKELGERIRDLRLRRQLTQAQLAKRISLAADTIGRIEHGRFSPSFDTLMLLADGLHVPVVALFSDDYDQADDLANLIRRLPEPHKGVAFAVLGTLHVRAVIHD